MKNFICNHCGKEFKGYGARKFCSRECYFDFMRAKSKRYPYTCKHCGKKDESYRFNQKFCSQECAMTYKRINHGFVINLVKTGMSDGEIAKKLDRSPNTIQQIRCAYGVMKSKANFIVDNKARRTLAFILRRLYEDYNFSRSNLKKLTGLDHPTIINLLSLGAEVKKEKEAENEKA